jgi:hypothetical protein
MTSGEKTFQMIRKTSNATVRNLAVGQCCFETDRAGVLMAGITEWLCDSNRRCREAIGPFDNVYLNILEESAMIYCPTATDGPNVSLECKTQKRKMHRTAINDTRLEVLTAVLMKIQVFWYMTTCRLVLVYQSTWRRM